MAQNYAQFDKRLTNIGRKHRAMSRGYTTRMRSDGLLVARASRPTHRISMTSVLLFVVGLFVFKAFLIASLSPESYEVRVNRLAEGTIVEAAGAWVMQIDPISGMIANQIGPILR